MQPFARAVRRTALGLSVGFGLFGAGCGGEGDSGAAEISAQITVISPPEGALVGAPHVTVEVDGTDLVQFWVENPRILTEDGDPVRVDGIRSGPSFYTYSVPLEGGSNDLQFGGVDSSGADLSLVVPVSSVPALDQAPKADPTPVFLESTPGSSTLHVSASAAPTEALLDIEGDGVIDEILTPNATYALHYSQSGVFQPRVTLRMANGVLLSSQDILTSPVTVMDAPGSEAPPVAFASPSPFVDLEYDGPGQRVFGLCDDDVVRVFDLAGTSLFQIPAQGWSGAQGIGVDDDGNVHVADTPSHRIFKLAASLGYTLDPGFGSQGQFGSFGSLPSKFAGPTDVAVVRHGLDNVVLVADSGNDRIQRFSASGLFEAELTFAGSASGALSQPTRIQAVGPNVVAILESAGTRVLVSEPSGTEVVEFSARDAAAGNTGTALNSSREPGLWVGSSDALRLYDFEGTLLRQHTRAPGTSDPRALIELQRSPDWTLLSSRTDDSLVEIQLSVDPPGASPLEVTQEFLAALVAKDAPAARALAAPPLHELIDQLVLDDAGIAALSVGGPPPVLISRTDTSAHVRLGIDGPTGTTTIDIGLRPNPATSAWHVYDI